MSKYLECIVKEIDIEWYINRSKKKIKLDIEND